jgi:hypothetical protein
VIKPGPINSPAYERPIDDSRILPQRERVLQFMLRIAEINRGAKWLTLREVSDALGFPEASISARFRDFRKNKFGAYEVDRRRRVEQKGTWEYRVTRPFILDGGDL